MKITLVRIYFDNMQTIGALQIDGKYFCDTQEGRAIDWKKEKKTPGKTAIPEGEYQLILEYSHHIRKEVIKVADVRHFSEVLIMSQRDSLNNSGIICIGRMNDEELINCNVYLRLLVDKIRKAVSEGEQVTLKVRSRFNWT